MARIRTFLAIDPGKLLRERVQDLQDELAERRAAVKWVEAANLHLTLLFLGEVEDRDLAAICRATSKVAAEIDPFTLSLEGVGCFPNMRRPARSLGRSRRRQRCGNRPSGCPRSSASGDGLLSSRVASLHAASDTWAGGVGRGRPDSRCSFRGASELAGRRDCDSRSPGHEQRAEARWSGLYRARPRSASGEQNVTGFDRLMPIESSQDKDVHIIS